MKGSNPIPYFFVKEIFLNIIIALRRLFITFFVYFECFYYSNFLCVFVFFWLLCFVNFCFYFFILHI